MVGSSVFCGWFCVGSSLEIRVSWDVNLNVGGTHVSLMSAMPWAPGLASCFSWGWREGTGLVGRDLRGVLMWYLTARRWLIFLKKALWAFWFWQPLAITQRSPCPAGLLSTTSIHLSGRQEDRSTGLRDRALRVSEVTEALVTLRHALLGRPAATRTAAHPLSLPLHCALRVSFRGGTKDKAFY